MKKIVYTRTDGGVSVVHPVAGTVLEDVIGDLFENVLDKDGHIIGRKVSGQGVVGQMPRQMTDDEAVARAMSLLPQGAVNPTVVDESIIIDDRTFRDAWKQSGAVLVVDMPQAREIHKDVLRDMRAPLLDALDQKYMVALEAGDKAAQADIATKKADLLDVTDDSAIADAKTPEELKDVIPDALKIDVNDAPVIIDPVTPIDQVKPV